MHDTKEFPVYFLITIGFEWFRIKKVTENPHLGAKVHLHTEVIYNKQHQNVKTNRIKSNSPVCKVLYSNI